MRFSSAKVLSTALVTIMVSVSLAACTKHESVQQDTTPVVPPAPATNALLNPDPALLTTAAPDSFDVLFETSKGNFTVRAHRDWAPNGVDRLYYLVSNGYYDDARFFRTIEGFMTQFGIHAQPEVTAAWQERRIAADPVKMGNTRGRLTYAMGGSPDTRTVQLFINYKANSHLDGMGFAAIGEVISGMDVVDSLHSGYGDTNAMHAPAITAQGNAYIAQNLPNLDYIKSARIIQ